MNHKPLCLSPTSKLLVAPSAIGPMTTPEVLGNPPRTAKSYTPCKQDTRTRHEAEVFKKTNSHTARPNPQSPQTLPTSPGTSTSALDTRRLLSRCCAARVAPGACWGHTSESHGETRPRSRQQNSLVVGIVGSVITEG